ncbi:MAG: hypothetical protein HY659_03160 [Rhizobiales bacterium]|nr:hypothetical protein [Hyphomicrobiales bacterium]
MARAKSAPPVETKITPAVNAAEAQALVAHLAEVMESLLRTLEQETALVRAGQLSDAAALEQSKNNLARSYMDDATRLKASQNLMARTNPGQFEALRRQHDEFHALLQINLAVLATAHAVSEGIMRGVADELARKNTPQAYGASGRTATPGPGSAQPLAVSRVL